MQNRGLALILIFILFSVSMAGCLDAKDVTIDDDVNFIGIQTGSDHNCAWTEIGSVICWGMNDVGQLGTGWGQNSWDADFSLKPSSVSLASDEVAEQVIVGDGHSCIILSIEYPLCWGDNSRGQIGDYSTFDSYAPMDVGFDGLVRVNAIEMGFRHVCSLSNSGLSNNGTVHCWGANDKGQVSSDIGNDQISPVLVIDGSSDPIVSLASSPNSRHTCALSLNGNVYCWGENENGQLGRNSTQNSATPIKVEFPNDETMQAIDINSDNTCSLSEHGDLFCWGSNSFGQLGVGTLDDSPTPMKVLFDSNSIISSFVLSWDHACALDIKNTMYCWGANDFAQLGDGTTEKRLRPVEPSFPVGTTAIEIYAEGWRTCALLSDGKLMCWGSNSVGEIGDGTTSSRFVPTKVALPSNSVVIFFSMQSLHSCVVLNHNEIYCWGMNTGVLGNGEKSDSSLPSRVYP